MRVAMLGPLEVRGADDRPVEVGGGRLRALLIRLALDAGHVVTSEALIDGIWGERPPAGAPNALQSLVSRLRRTVSNGTAPQIESHPAGYRLTIPPEQVDALQFERLAGEGHRELAAGRHASAAEQLAEAERLWRGPALADVLDLPFAGAPAARLEELRIASTEDRIDAELGLGRHAEVVGDLERLGAAYPLRERIRGQLIRALYGTGRQADALAAYEQTRRALADELGIDPSPELAALHVAVLRRDPALQPAAGPTAAPAAPPPRRQTLRAQLTSFVGRDDEVRRIRKLLAGERLVTLVGPGGAGKTRLATESAARLEETIPDGVWFVELAPITNPGDVPQSVLAAIGAREAALFETSHLEVPDPAAAGRDATARLLETLATKRALLVIDNCEHLIDAAAALADQLLAGCPDLRILATSREPLSVTGETLCPVPPLAVPNADLHHHGSDPEETLDYASVRLFVDRANAVRPGFRIDPTTVDPVVEICRRLDGMPLAIELAAARLRALPVAQIASRLDDRFRLLTGGSRTALPRHQTLRAVVDWSWDLLDDAERRLARRLAVFAGGATVESAEALGAVRAGPGGMDSAEVLDVLTSLVDKSLVELDDRGEGEARYRMLETVRAYGLERLAEAGETEPVLAAHADHFLRLALSAEPMLRTRDQLEWIGRLRAEHPNLLAALRWSVDAGNARVAVDLVANLLWFWFLQGNRGDGLYWGGRALAVPGETEPASRAMAATFHGISLLMTGDLPGAEAFFAEARELAGRPGVQATHPSLGLLTPMTAIFTTDRANAKQIVLDALPGLGRWEQASALMVLGQLAENEGDPDGTAHYTARSHEEFTAIGDRWGIAGTVRVLASLRGRAGDQDGAVAAYREALTLTEELGAIDDLSHMHTMIALELVRGGDPAGAQVELTTASALALRYGFPEQRIIVNGAQAEVAIRGGDWRAARRWLDEALRTNATLGFGHPQLHASLLSALGQLDILEGAVETGRDRLREALGKALSSEDMPIIALVTDGLSLLAVVDDDPEWAAELGGLATAMRGYVESATDPSGRVERIKDRIGEAAYDAAYARGAALTTEQAVKKVRPPDLDVPEPWPRTTPGV